MNLIELWIFIKNEIAQKNNGSNSTEVISCIIDDDLGDTIDFMLIAPSAVVILIFMFMKPRVNLWKICCYGLPSITYPMNTLEDRSNRFSYAAAYGILANMCFRMIQEGYIIRTGIPSWGIFIDYIATTCVFGTIVYPIFVCIGSGNILGYTIGMLYTWTYTALFCVKNLGCNTTDEELMLFTTISILPILMCCFYLCLSFPLQIYFQIKKLCSTRYRKLLQLKSEKDPASFRYVQALLLRKKLQEPELMKDENGRKKNILQKLWGLIDKARYKSVKGFRYSSRIIGPTFAGLIVIYKINIIFIAALKLLYGYYDADIREGISNSGDYKELLFNLYSCLKVVVFISICSTVLFVLINSMLALTNYRTNMLQLYRGDYKEIQPLKEFRKMNILVSSLKYSGYVVSYMFYGFFFNLVLFVIIYSIPAFTVTIITTDLLFQYIIDNFKIVLLPLIIFIVFTILQKFVAKFVFLQQNGLVLAITNRRLFFNISYYFFFMNIFVGLFSCLLSIVKGAFLGMMFMGRLDKSRLARYYEDFDPAYYAYIGQLHVEHAHTNPILLTFVELIVKKQFEKRSRFVMVCQNDFDDDDTPLDINRKRARLRWFKAYTLINNPKLVILSNFYLRDHLMYKTEASIDTCSSE